MSARDKGAIVEEKAMRPAHAAVVAALFSLLMTIAVFFILVLVTRSEIERETDMVGAFLAAHMVDGTAHAGELPHMGVILAMRAALTALPGGDAAACTEALAAWFEGEYPHGDRSGIPAFVRPICEGKAASVGNGRLFGVIDVLIRRVDAAGRTVVEGITIRRSELSPVELVMGDRRLLLLALGIAAITGLFAYGLRRETYRKYLEVSEKAGTDGLSGVLRRELFTSRAEQIVADARTLGHSASLLAIDIDHFKSINDRFGHAAGDAVIRSCGNLISGTVRGGDIVGRTGGEEFMVLLPDLPKFIAAEVADRLRKRVKSHGFTFGEETVFVTVSIGVASMMQADNWATLSDRADRRLYKAKRAGRDRVVWEDDSTFDY